MQNLNTKEAVIRNNAVIGDKKNKFGRTVNCIPKQLPIEHIK